MPRHSWSEFDTLMVMDAYCLDMAENGRPRTESSERLAALLGIKASSVWMKFGNCRALDVKGGATGLKSASRMHEQLWKALSRSPDMLFERYARACQSPPSGTPGREAIAAEAAAPDWGPRRRRAWRLRAGIAT